MKRLLLACALVALILLRVTTAVNTHVGKDGPRADGVVVAQGTPAPPWPPAEKVITV